MEAKRTEAKLGSGVAAQFTVLKQRLLHRYLNEVPDWEIHARIMQEADDAERLAWFTSYPFLIFPCLFEERARMATEQARRERERERYWPPPANPLPAPGPACIFTENPHRRLPISFW